MTELTRLTASVFDEHGIAETNINITIRDGQLLVLGPRGGELLAEDGGVEELVVTKAAIVATSAKGRSLELWKAGERRRERAAAAPAGLRESVASLLGWRKPE